MKKLILLRGIPGCGKSTLAKSLGGIHIEADQYFMEDGEYRFDGSKIKLAHNYCQTQTEAWMDTDGEQVNVDTIIVSNTFTQEWEMKPYYEMAEKYGYIVFSLIVENRHGGVNEHDVPDDVLDKMKKRFEIKLENENLNEPQKAQLNIGAVSFSISDKVYMNSPFGVYTGIVKDVKDGKMTIESHSPTGNGTMWAEYDIEGTDWQKY